MNYKGYILCLPSQNDYTVFEPALFFDTFEEMQAETKVYKIYLFDEDYPVEDVELERMFEEGYDTQINQYGYEELLEEQQKFYQFSRWDCEVYGINKGGLINFIPYYNFDF